MSLLISFLTLVLILNCLLLILLVLIQLPKKEAGAGVAFGGGATDALFGAGSGNALTKVTKYSATIFLGLSLVLSLMNAHFAREGKTRLEQAIQKQAAGAQPASVPPAIPTNQIQIPAVTPPAPANNAPVVNATNAGGALKSVAPQTPASAPGAAAPK
jgi:preprotein translocase subunit SecG